MFVHELLTELAVKVTVITENFQREKNFTDCSLLPCQRTPHPPNFVEKICESFLPRKLPAIRSMKEWKPWQVFLSLTSMCFHLQAIESYNQSKETSNNMNKDNTGTSISEESVDNDQKSNSHPNFENIFERKFEISELCEIFFN